MITEEDQLKLTRILKKLNQLCKIIFMHTDMTTQDKGYWYAIARGLEIIGETTKSISSIARESHTDFPWFTVEHLRDLLNHGHFKMERGSKIVVLKEKIIADINTLKEIITTILDDKIEMERSEKRKEKDQKTDARSTREKLLAEKDKSLSGFREAGLYLDLSQENEQLTVGDLRILKSRLRRPTFDLMLIQTEIQFILNCLDQTAPIKDDDVLQLIIEHGLGIIGQSMKEIREHHEGFILVSDCKETFEKVIKARNLILHAPYSLDFKESIVPAVNEIESIFQKIKDSIKNIKTIMNKVYELHKSHTRTTSTSYSLKEDEEKQPGKLIPKHEAAKPEEDIGGLIGMGFDDDLFETKSPKGSPRKWQYEYYSDDDEIAKHFFQPSKSDYNDTIVDRKEREKIFEEDRERKRAKQALQLFTEDKKGIENTEISASSSACFSLSFKK